MHLRTILLALGLAASAHAASLLTLTNPVANGSMNTSAGNNDRTDWNGTVAFPVDPDETSAVDYASITVAHDDNNFYLRQQLYRTDNGGFLSNNQIVMFDTDQSRSSGYRGANDTLSVGAEYMLQGASLYLYTGTGIDWSWNFVAGLTYDDFPLNDHEFTLGQSSLGSPASFDVIAITDFFGGGDAYPDGAHGGGGGGGYYTYTTIPEPGAASLLALALLLRPRRRRA